MTNIEKDLKEEIKKLNDRVITLESKIKKSKSKFINVISNNYSF
jgi:chaperonin cofactor prefoldin